MSETIVTAIIIAAVILVVGGVIWAIISRIRGREDPLARDGTMSPHFFESPPKASHGGTFRLIDKATGQEQVYESFDELPREVREMIKQVGGGSAASETHVSHNQKFVFDIDGQHYEYDNIDDVPAKLRERVQLLRGPGAPKEVTQRITLNVNGKHYEFDSVEDVPEELRRHLPSDLFEQ